MADVCLMSDDAEIAEFIAACGDRLVRCDGDWLVSFGHRSIIGGERLRHYGNRAINLHIGALPWGRGSHPNYWAWKNREPHGVTLHVMTERLDDGPIIAQRRVCFGPGFTYRTSWLRLMAEARALFMEYWPELRLSNRGSYHRVDDLPANVNWEGECE